MGSNPYAPPQAPVADVLRETTELEAIRLEHIDHEASVRSISALYYLGGSMSILAALLVLGGVAPGPAPNAPIGGVVALSLGFGVLSILVASGLRRLRAWARTATIVLAVIGLLGFPIGTLLNAYILYLLLAAKGRRVFAPDYAAVVQATPQVKYRTSIVVWIMLGLLVLVIAALVIGAVANNA